jgi:hypothetical protein
MFVSLSDSDSDGEPGEDVEAFSEASSRRPVMVEGHQEYTWRVDAQVRANANPAMHLKWGAIGAGGSPNVYGKPRSHFGPLLTPKTASPAVHAKNSPTKEAKGIDVWEQSKERNKPGHNPAAVNISTRSPSLPSPSSPIVAYPTLQRRSPMKESYVSNEVILKFVLCSVCFCVLCACWCFLCL